MLKQNGSKSVSEINFLTIGEKQVVNIECAAPKTKIGTTHHISPFPLGMSQYAAWTAKSRAKETIMIFS